MQMPTLAEAATILDQKTGHGGWIGNEPWEPGAWSPGDHLRLDGDFNLESLKALVVVLEQIETELLAETPPQGA